MIHAPRSHDPEPDISYSDESQPEKRLPRTALQQSLLYLNRRSYTVWEMDRRLQTAKYAQSEREQAIARLQEWGYLDDDRFAHAYCCSKKERSSRIKVIYELTKKGLSPQCIDNTLAQDYDEEEELNYCCKRMLREWENVPKPLESSTRDWRLLVEKFKAKFARKGYPCGIIEKIIDKESSVFFPTRTKGT